MKIFCLVLLAFSLSSCASNAVKIGNYENPKKALLVIDMQIDYIGEDAKFPIERKQTGDLIKITNEIIQDFSKNNYTVIYIRNIFRENDWKNRFRNYAAIEGTAGTGIDPRINIVSKNIFDKYTPSAFSNTDFVNFLTENNINELYLCGVMADQCVYETALGALNRGYIVNYFANAVGSLSVKNIERATRKLGKKGINIVEF